MMVSNMNSFFYHIYHSIIIIICGQLSEPLMFVIK